MATSVKVIAASPCLDSDLFTLQLHFPRMILAELNTHRMLAKSTSSSRAIPVEKIIEKVLNEPALPRWTSNRAGMQGDPATTELADAAAKVWSDARDAAVKHAKDLMALGIHKQDANRLLEPFVYVDTVITGTDWENFFNLRCHPAAAPLIQELAISMRDAIWKTKSTSFGPQEWHLPYVTKEEFEGWTKNRLLLCWVSAARCARVSYLNHDGTSPDVNKDLLLADKLYTSRHMTPFEHIALPLPFTTTSLVTERNANSCIRGNWFSMRFLLERDGGIGQDLLQALGEHFNHGTN